MCRTGGSRRPRQSIHSPERHEKADAGGSSPSLSIICGRSGRVVSFHFIQNFNARRSPLPMKRVQNPRSRRIQLPGSALWVSADSGRLKKVEKVQIVAYASRN
jgi:hypothetical protein